MRFSHYLRYGIVAFYASSTTSAHFYHIRADASITASGVTLSSAPLSTSAGGSFVSTSSGQVSSSPAVSSSVIISKATASTASSKSISDSAAVALSTTASNQTASNQAASDDAGIALPIQPIITPAIGIAGAVMIATGLVLCLVGIKNTGLYNFLSTGYLASLAVTVLVIYVMDPPVSNAVQGAYFVAAAVTGLVFGSLALVFSEITDGLGCALGGFCLGMWLLTLVDGGLVKSRAGKAIILASFSLGLLVVSFSRYTRNYGLITCISFAGGTITILGVDCFSRVGLKEFWIYLWDLNDNEFPLNTNTYPISRGMRVETAGIVALFLVGVISQLKLWKVIKTRRETREAERYKEQESREKQESEIGRKMMDNVIKDQARWISVYDRQETGSSADGKVSNESVTKTSASVSERPISGEDLEMLDLGSSRGLRDLDTEATEGNAKPAVNVRISQATDGDKIHRIDSSGNPIDCYATAVGPPNALEPPITPTSITASPQSTGRQSLPPTPEVVPLPFTVPVDRGGDCKDADSMIGSTTGSQRKSSKRKSAGSTLKRLSLRSVASAGPSQEDLVAPPDDDDGRASSVAATIDILDVDDLSPEAVPEPRSPFDPNFGSQQGLLPEETRIYPPLERSLSAQEIETMNESVGQGLESEQMGKDDDNDRESMAESIGLSIVSDKDEECLRPTVTGHEGVESSDQTGNQMSVRDSQIERRNSLTSGTAKSEVSPPETLASLRNSFSELPKRLMIYRTNEWAKHAAEADVPQAEEIIRPDSPSVQVQHEKPQHISQKPQLVESTGSAAHQSSSLQPSEYGVRNSTAQDATPPSEQPPCSQNNSTTTLSRESSTRNRINLRNSRNLSASMLSTTATEEFGDGAIRHHRRRDTDVLTPLPTDTLLDKRKSRLKQRLSTLSFNSNGLASTPSVPAYAFASTPNLVDSTATSSPITPDDSASVRNVRLDDAITDPDDVPLAERRTQLQRQSSGSSTSIRQVVWPLPHSHKSFAHHSMNSLPSQQQTRLPLSNSGASQGAKRASNYRAWRESIQYEFVREKPVADEVRRAAMWEAKRKEDAMKLQADLERRNRDAALGRSMRTGAMVNRHNELLRRMQAQVNLKED